MIESFDELRTGLEDVTDAETEPARGAYAVAEYELVRRPIYVWAPTSSPTPVKPTHLWGISEIRLVWRRTTGSSTGHLSAGSAAAAVDPPTRRATRAPSEKQSILSRTPADPGEITDSAEQEWFEYANAAR